jgi:clusterin-associated protein 1
VLGFERTVSLESFKTPNFPLIAEIISFLIGRLDHTAAQAIPTHIDDEADRVTFIKAAVHFLVYCVSM